MTGNRRHCRTFRIFAYMCMLFMLTTVYVPLLVHASGDFGDIVISVKSPPTGESHHGYIEYIISIKNNSYKETRNVTIQGPAVNHNFGDCIQRISRSAAVGPASTINLSLLQPPLNMNGYDLEVIIDGRLQTEQVSFTPTRHCYYKAFDENNPVPLLILLSRSINKDDFNDSAVRSLSSSDNHYYNKKSIQFINSNFKTEYWSDNWLAYSRYDGVVLTSADLSGMPDSARSALFHYAASGGSLLILGDWEAPGNDVFCAERDEHLKLYYTGFGVCISSNSVNFKNWGETAWRKLKTMAWEPSLSTIRNQTSIVDANKKFPVVDDLTIPVKGLFVLVLLFTIIIGPVNLAVLARKKRRIWIVWTIPAISIVASLSVFVYSILAEGWESKTRSRSVTILNESSHRAFTIGLLAYYCPLTPESGLHFNYNTEVSCQALETRHNGKYIPGGRSRFVDVTNDQHLSSGWVVSRIPSHFFIRKNETRRERLNITADIHGKTTVLNGLGADIVKIWFSDRNGRIYSAENISAGKKTALVPTGQSLPGKRRPGIWRETFGRDWISSNKNIADHPEVYLKPDCYIAVLNDSIFIEEALENQKSTDSQSIVFGMLKGKSDAY